MKQFQAVAQALARKAQAVKFGRARFAGTNLPAHCEEFCDKPGKHTSGIRSPGIGSFPVRIPPKLHHSPVFAGTPPEKFPLINSPGPAPIS